MDMRRKDRELTRAEGLEIIDKCAYAVLAVADGETPYALPLSVCRIGGDVYFHSAAAGKKTELLTDGAKVRMVFVGEVRAYENEFTTAYESAIAVGEVTLVTEREKKIAALKALCEKYCPANMREFDREIGRSLAVTNVYKVTLLSITAKAKR